MKKLVFYTLIALLPMNCLGQGLYEIQAESFTKLKDDPAALENKVTTEEGRPCALIKVNTLLDSLEFESNLDIPKVEKNKNGYWVFVSPQESRIQILKEDCLPFEFHIDTQYVLESYQVYRLELKTNATVPLVLTKYPRSAQLFLDNQRIPGTQVTDTLQEVSLGQHIITMKKEGFSPLTDTIVVKENSRVFSFEMDRLGKLCINSTPKNAHIYIDGERKGYSNDCFYKSEGDYHIHLKKDHYLPFDTTISLSNRSNQLYHFQLTYNRGTIQLESNVEDPQIYVDGKRIYSSSCELPVKKHKITVKKEGYHQQSQWVTPERNGTRLLRFDLEPKTGDLTLNVKTEEAHVKLYRNDQLVDEWIGPRTLHDIQAGKYQVVINKEYFVEYDKYIPVKSHEHTYKEISLRSYEKKKAGAILWSLFIPGAGQYYSTGQNGRGTLYLLTGLAAGGGYLYFDNGISELNQDYKTTASFYENTQSTSARQAYETEMEQLKSDMNQMEQYREYTLIAAASAYAIGFLDALLFGGKRVPPDDIATTWSQDQKRFQMGLKPLYGGMGVSMSFRF